MHDQSHDDSSQSSAHVDADLLEFPIVHQLHPELAAKHSIWEILPMPNEIGNIAGSVCSLIKIFNVQSESEDRTLSCSTGTGFFFEFEIDNRLVPCIVTNRHVIQDAQFLRLHVRTRSMVDLNSANITGIELADHDGIIFHPDPNVDLAIIASARLIASFANRFNSVIEYSRILESSISDYDKGEIDALENVFTIGYPQHHYDIIFPILYHGVLAPTPEVIKGQSYLKAKLKTNFGNSGSPMLQVPPIYDLENSPHTLENARLIGICCKAQSPIQGSDASKNPHFTYALAIKAKELLEFKPLIKSRLDDPSQRSRWIAWD